MTAYWRSLQLLSNNLISSVLLMIALTCSIQTNTKILGSEREYSVNSLFIGIFSNGDALIQHDIKLNASTKQLSIRLLGENVTNLSVKNYTAHSLSYYVIVKTNELRIKPQGSSEIRITYLTPTIVDKKDRIWTFSINSTSSFTVKLPNDAVVTSLGDHQPKLMRRLGEQELLTFDPGQSTVKYLLGYVGTREQAETAIISAQNDITAVQNSHGGINLTDAKETLGQARIAMDNGNLVDAERLASNSSYLANKISSDFELAKKTISIANDKIRDSQEMKLEVEQAQGLISQSNIKFSLGNYVEAITLARLALETIPKTPENVNQYLAPIIGVVSAIVVAILAVMLHLGKLRSMRIYYKRIKLNGLKSISPDNLQKIKNQEKPSDSKAGVRTDSDLLNRDIDLFDPLSKISDIHKRVERIVLEHPDLREEDQKVLYFLADKDGAAFEGEIRTKFLLPKTSLWRLVKRLERLELIEVTKMAGQNLLRLRL